MAHKVVYEVGKNREAGAHIQVIDNRGGSFESLEGMEDPRDAAWVTFCDTHSNYCLHRTRMTAEGFAHHPTEWCETCREEGEARPKQEQDQTNASAGRGDLYEAYMYVVRNWAVTAKELADAQNIDTKKANALLRRLKNKNLVEGTTINEDRHLTWQSYYDIDNEHRLNGETLATADYDSAFPAGS